MKRILGRLFNFAAAVSATLFVGACALWVVAPHAPWQCARRSVWRTDKREVWIQQSGFGWDDRAVGVYWIKSSLIRRTPISDEAYARVAAQPAGVPLRGRDGFQYQFDWEFNLNIGNPYLGPDQFRYVVVPFPHLTAALSVLPGAWLGWRLFRRQRALARARRVGRCATCGYDLRATPEGGGALLDRCPECGNVGGVRGAQA